MSRKTIAIGSAAALGVIVLWFVLLWSPQQGRKTDARTRREAAEARVATLRVQLQRLQDLKRNEALQLSQIETLRVAVPDQPNLAQFILDANDAATKSGIDFLSISPSQPTGGGPQAPASMAVALNITGGYFQVLDYMNRLTDLPRLVVIDQFSLTPDETGATMTVAMQGRLFTSSAAAAPGAPAGASPPGAPTTTVPGATTTTSAGPRP